MTTPAGQVLYENGQATLVFERRLAHAPQAVWDAITDPEHLHRWYMTKAMIEGRVGGAIEFWSGPAKVHVTGKVLVWDPPRVFEHERIIEPTAAMPLSERSVMRWELAPDQNGTRLTLTHARLAPTMAIQIAPATHALLDRLEDELAGRPLTDMMKRFAELRPRYG
ncbi:MAG TPA: SRPBCC family protein [Candidatus Thermoplasmatota archaeon]|nr:SRPBCC family protein [Candidatus Thermoplasmatota archaeon]